MLRREDAGPCMKHDGAGRSEELARPEMGTCLQQRALELPRRSVAGVSPATDSHSFKAARPVRG